MKAKELIAASFFALAMAWVSGSSAQTLGGAGTPGAIDKSFKNFQKSDTAITLGDEAHFVGAYDVRCAVVQPDGKIVIGGSFRIAKNNVEYDLARPIEVVWKNIARLNSDGTLDVSFISKAAVDLAREGLYDNQPLEWGTDQAVYSVLIELLGDSYQYICAGDFLTFSHSAQGIQVPRLRYLVLNALTPNPLAEDAEPLIELTTEVAEANGFDGAVRNLRRLSTTTPIAQLVVADQPQRLALTVAEAPIGTIVFQTDVSLFYQRIAAAGNTDADWVLITDTIASVYFAMGDFQVVCNNEPHPYIVNVTRDGTTLSVTEDWIVPPNPNGRVNDIALLGDENIFVGEFTTVNGVSSNRIAACLLDGSPGLVFNPGTGFDADAYAIAADPILQTMVVVGAFENYNGSPANRICRLDIAGNIDPTFPAANNGNSSAANGTIRTICRQPDGRMIIAGGFTSYNGIPRSGIARIERDGSLDLTFTPQGTASGITGFARDLDGGPGTSSLFARPVVIGNFDGIYNSGYDGVARLLGGSWPTIWYQPSEINGPHTVEAGDDITLYVVATDNYIGYPGYPVPAMPYTTTQAPSEPLLYQWRRNGTNIDGANQSYLDINSITYRQAGSYSVRIYNSQYSVVSQSVQVGVLNPFTTIIPLTGLTVNGIIDGSQGLNNGLGGKISFTVNRMGSATGTITMLLPGGVQATYRFVGQFDSSGLLEVTINRSNTSPLYLQLSMDMVNAPTNFDFTDGSSTLSDGVNTATIRAWNNSWTLANPATAVAGSYHVGLDLDPVDLAAFDTVLSISRPRVPQGYGYLTMVIPSSTGLARVVGVLADSTPFTTSAVVWGDPSATVPIWIPLYTKRGALKGDLAINTAVLGNPVSANLEWTKPGNLPRLPGMLTFSDVPLTASVGSGIYDAAAFTGSLAPPPSNFVLSFDDGIWTTPNGGLASPFAQAFSINGGTTTVALPNPQSVALSFSPTSGLASGTFRNADLFGRLRAGKFKGIILTQGGAPNLRGHFVMPNRAASPTYYIGGSVTGY